MRIWNTKAIGVIGAAALLAACGDDDGGGNEFANQDPQEIISQAEADMKALESLRLSGDLQVDGQPTSIDMAISKGGDCAGSFSQGDATAEIISIGGQSYLKPNQAFWEQTGGPEAEMIVDMVDGRWVSMPADEADFSEFCDLDSLLEQMGDDDEDSDAEVLSTEELDGRDAVKMATTSDVGDPVSVWVAVDSPHVILQMEVTEGEEPGVMTFSEFDEEIDVEAPAEGEVVDLSQLGG